MRTRADLHPLSLLLRRFCAKISCPRGRKLTQSKLRFLSISLVALLVVTSAGLIFGAWYFKQLENTVTEKFEGRKWVFPSKIYSDSYLLYVGAPLRPETLIEKLRRLGYYATTGELRAKGEYRTVRSSGTIDVFLHDFALPSEQFTGVPVRLSMQGNSLARIENLATGQEMFSLELEPELVTG